jgi:DNA polymerase-3 subunit gamma/tau
VDDSRELVTQVRYAPQEGKYKMYILDEVHMLSANAFNAFLKTLEEPPPYAKFILATTEKHKILPTILSRCQIFDFKRITNADTVEHLVEIVEKEHTTAEKAALYLIAQKSEGCMRDALSMLDKIVSFTGGQLTYANTLEHLNLLDEDYFFRMLDALLVQDLATTLLLYDEINKKGFEGDTVLNGLAEFMRNLLMCLDDRAIPLLDVLEGMHERYAAMAKKLSLNFILSSLNVLSAAESGFKLARNRRLHVELWLIKLCNLQQAIEFAVTPQGEVKLQKRVAGPVALGRREVEPVMLQATNVAPLQAKLTVESAQQAVEVTPVESRVVQNMVPTGSETAPASVSPPVVPIKLHKAANPAAVSTGLLQQIRQLHDANPLVPVVVEKLPLTTPEVLVIWNAHIEMLKTQQKHTSVTSYTLARLRVSDQHLDITSISVFNNKAIESELSDLLETLKARFHNPDITIALHVEDTEEKADGTEPRFLSSQERFLLMATDYPLVRQLKERLNLEVRY